MCAAENKNYLVRIRPLEPYFFGSERTFGFDGNQIYYIKSEVMPAQTTILGGLRFALLRHFNSGRSYSGDEITENIKAIGEKSFSMKDACEFGCIKTISPLFVMHGDEWLIPAPLDHAKMRNGIEGNEGEDTKKRYQNEVYSPFREYSAVTLYDTDGASSKQLLPIDYVDKEGLADCFINISCDKLPVVPKWRGEDSGIFDTVEKTGIQKKGDKEAYFKRSCCVMMPGYCFGVIVTLSADTQPQDQVVYLGQQKSAFRFEFTACDESPAEYAERIGRIIDAAHEGIAALDGKAVYYAASDIYADCGTLYGQSACSLAQVRDFRYLSTDNSEKSYFAKIKKSEKLYRLVRAGSVFITDQDDVGEIENALLNSAGCKTIGMNILVGGKSR